MQESAEAHAQAAIKWGHKHFLRRDNLSHFERAMGWLPDYPGFRDYTDRTASVNALLRPKRLRPVAR